MHQAIKLLRVGDHFGEIGMLYKCPRTATVVSMNYNNFAKLSYYNWREIVNMYPKYLLLLKHYYRTEYNDPRKKFLTSLISRISNFNNWLPRKYVDDIIFRMNVKVLDEGSILQKQGARANSIIFIEYGEVKVVTQFEGHEFVFDVLYPGSVINLKSFFLEDPIAVDYICQKNTKVL